MTNTNELDASLVTLCLILPCLGLFFVFFPLHIVASIFCVFVGFFLSVCFLVSVAVVCSFNRERKVIELGRWEVGRRFWEKREER